MLAAEVLQGLPGNGRWVGRGASEEEGSKDGLGIGCLRGKKGLGGRRVGGVEAGGEAFLEEPEPGVAGKDVGILGGEPAAGLGADQGGVEEEPDDGIRLAGRRGLVVFFRFGFGCGGRFFRDGVEEGLRGKGQAGTESRGESFAGHRVGKMGGETGEFADKGGFGRRVVQFAGGLRLIEGKVEVVGRAVDERAESVRAVFADERIGVLTRGERCDSHAEAGGEEDGEGALDGRAAGAVGIEAEDGGIDVALEQAGLGGCEGGALRGDDVGQSTFRNADEVELSLAHDGQAGVGQRAAGFVQPVKRAAFAEERGFRGIDIFRRVFGGRENASAESNDFAVVVADGKHESLPEAVGQRLVLATVEETAGAEFVVFETGGTGVLEQRVTAVGGVAEVPILRDVGVDGARFQIVARGGTGGGAEEVGLEPVGGDFVQFEEASAQFAALVIARCGGFLDDRDPGFLGQSADGGGEVDAFVFHDELEDAAARAAAEAVVGLLLRTHVERGGFLAVERAERAPAGAGAFEREVAADDLDDVIGRGDALDAFLGDAGHGRSVAEGANVRAGILPIGLEGGGSAGKIGVMRSVLLIAVLMAAPCAWAQKKEDKSAGTPPPEVRKLEGAIPEGAVVVIPLKGAVSQAQFYFLRRMIKAGEAANASAFILDMDTPGGELGAAVEILQALMKVEAPTFTYVDPNAGSAGALIALGTKQIWMAPVSAIGAAAPVMGTGGEIPETLAAKVVSYYSGYFRSAAESNGHNPEIAEAFINKEKEVKVGGKVINEKGELLTMSAQEATQKIGGKPVLAQGIADSVADLVRDAGLEGPVVEAEPSGFEMAAIYITMLAPLFLLGGIIGTYIEFKSPGFGVPGAIAAVCFLLFFAGHYVAGLTGMEVVAVFVLGLLLVLIELIFIPGIVVLALAGTLMMFGALLWAMVDYYPSAPEWPSLDVFLLPLANLGVAIGLSGVAIFFLAQFFPKLPVLRRLVLTTSEPGGGSLTMDEPGAGRLSVRAGDRGKALSMLRPVGRAEFGGQSYDARSEGNFIPPGAAVVALRVEGGEVVVERA